MAEDIDIEEHDILENPMIKRIFPDLSVLKQEVIDFEVGTEVEDKPIDKITNIVKNCDENVSGISEFSINTRPSSRKNIDCSGSNKLTKYIKKKLKVILPNIGPYLVRTNRFCEMCLILFQNKSSLNDHKLSSHPPLVYCTEQNTPNDNINKKNPSSNKHEYDIINLQTGDETNYYESCFHCNMLFQTQKDLIDHYILYNIINTKTVEVTFESVTDDNHIDSPIVENNEILQSTANVKKNLERHRVGEIGESYNIYSCPICSYYFQNEDFYKNHVIVKHKAYKSFESMHIHTVAFNPLCKFCHLKYFDLSSYNTHLRKNHKIEMLRQVNNANYLRGKNYLETKISVKTLKKSTYTNKTSKYVQLSTQSSKNSETIADHTNVLVEASKIILFVCSECHVHFLTYKDAIKHTEHSKLRNWECKNCCKFFKNSDVNIHQKQHKLSNYFFIKNVNPEIQPKILYKCPKCAVHLYKENVFEHCRMCELEQPKSSYCKVCDILIIVDIKKSHDDDHHVRNFIPSDFKIIDLEYPFAQYDKKNKKSCDESEQNIATVHSLNSEDHSEMINLEKVTSNNTVEKFKTIKYNYYSSAKTKSHSIRLNYCTVCKCYIIKTSKSDIHLKYDCVNIAKHLCKYCGLTFSNKSKRHHRRLHLKYGTLKLEDFIFYNLHTKKLIKPPMPLFPKCASCKRHFISNVQLRNHLCGKNNHLICSICRLTFSNTAYKLHMPFHYYNSSFKQSYEKKFKKSIHKVNKNDKIVSYNNKLVTEEVILIIYTCKNCNLSVNIYDEVVEHCQLHRNLNKIDENYVECATCLLKFSTSSYKKHIKLHKYCKNKNKIRFFFDVSYFGCTNRKWLKHIYRSVSENIVDKFIKDSIYKYETRIKMKVVQEGPSCLTVYKCDKCQCIIDYNSTYEHVVSCCPNSEISDCSFCELSFACSATRDSHEKIHSNSYITITSYKIVLFNYQDQNIYNNLSNLKKCYVVYECRNCHVLVEKYNYDRHKCNLEHCKKCNYCGLLIFESDFVEHISKHKLLPTFNENKIKVVLLGKKRNDNNFEPINNIVPTFNGIVCDYTFYKCINCEVCVRDIRQSKQHSCLIDAAKSQCPKCDLIFDEGKLKGHLKLHDEDPNCNKETILVECFGKEKLKKRNTEPELSLMNKKKPNKVCEIVSCSNNITNSKINKFPTKDKVKQITANLYKCTCGLHYMQFSSLEAHKTKCSGKSKSKQSIQSCSKCGLNFTSEVLFKHLLEHHGDKNVEFKYEFKYVSKYEN